MTKAELEDKYWSELPKPDKRYVVGKIGKDNKGTFRGHPDTVALKHLEIPPYAPMEMKLNPPIVISIELAKWLEEQK